MIPHLYFRISVSASKRQSPAAVYRQRYGAVTIGDRGGVVTPHTKLTLAVDGE
jgi:hypothetical protein